VPAGGTSSQRGNHIESRQPTFRFRPRDDDGDRLCVLGSFLICRRSMGDRVRSWRRIPIPDLGSSSCLSGDVGSRSRNRRIMLGLRRGQSLPQPIKGTPTQRPQLGPEASQCSARPHPRGRLVHRSILRAELHEAFLKLNLWSQVYNKQLVAPHERVTGFIFSGWLSDHSAGATSDLGLRLAGWITYGGLHLIGHFPRQSGDADHPGAYVVHPVTMVYGPIAAVSGRDIPARNPLQSMSAYHIGNGPGLAGGDPLLERDSRKRRARHRSLF